MTQTKRPNYVLWMLCVFMLLSAASYFFRPKEPEISYAEVVQLFEQEKVKSFTVQDTTLTLKLREAVDGKTELRKELYDFDLFYDDLNDLVVEQKAAGILEDYNYSANHSPNYLAIALPYVIAVAGLFAIWYFFSMRASGGGNDRMAKFGNATFRHGSESARKTTFADVAGADEEKEELAEIVDFLRDPQRFVELGARIPKGVLLVGPPGTGKTLLARAVAGEAGVEFLSISGSDFVEMYVGVGASRVRDLFKEASKVAPAIIFIDEIDAIGRSRDSKFGGNDEREQTLNQLLAEIDGFDSSKGVVILAATNRPEILDKALLRAGRFDRRIVVDRPNLEGRYQTLLVHTRNIRLAEDVDLKKIAQATAGAVGADLANLVNEAALRAVRQGRQLVNQQDLLASFETVIAGTEKKGTVLTDIEKRIVSYHEVGHALVAALRKHTQPVSKITIVPHTSGALGYTMQMPEEEKYLNSKEELLVELQTLLGGRAAEQTVFGIQTTGAANDIQRATDLARKMVTQYGMGDRIGLMTLASGGNEYLDGQAYMDCSQSTAAEADEEIRKLIAQSYEEAKQLLIDNRPLLDEIALYLLQKETITGDELMAYVNADSRKLTDGEEQKTLEDKQ